MSMIKRNNILKLTEDLAIELCYLLLYRFGGVKAVAITMLIEWFVYLLKDWIIPLYKEVKLKLIRKKLDKALDEFLKSLSEETC